MYAKLEISFGHMVSFLDRHAGDLHQVAYLSHLAELPFGKTFETLACFDAVRKHATVTAMYIGCTVRFREWRNLMLH